MIIWNIKRNKRMKWSNKRNIRINKRIKIIKLLLFNFNIILQSLRYNDINDNI